MPQVNKLIWVEGNIPHIARHNVTPDEVEQACQREPITKEAKQGRIMAIGQTQAGRILAIVLAPSEDEGIYFVVTARTADKKERQLFRQTKGGETK
jgi:uncharacterized DUF497 family protein